MKRGKHTKPSKPIILILFIIIFSVSILCTIFYFYSVYKEKQTYNNILNDIEINVQDITETKTERMLQVEKLQKENTDIVGWLEIDGTDISYPVLQCEDNEYYLTRNYKKEKSSIGSLFLDKDYDFSIPSSNLLIYGHRNSKGLMFENLIKYKDEEFYKQHQTMKFTTEKEETTFEIIAVFYSRVYYQYEKDVFRYYYFINAENEAEYNEFVDNAKKASIYDTKKTAKYGDQLLTLSTCEYSQEDGRFVVVARELK